MSATHPRVPAEASCLQTRIAGTRTYPAALKPARGIIHRRCQRRTRREEKRLPRAPDDPDPANELKNQLQLILDSRDSPLREDSFGANENPVESVGTGENETLEREAGVREK